LDPENTIMGCWLGAFGAANAARQGLCLIQVARTRPGPERPRAKPPRTFADQVAPLLKRARAKGFDFLAYLLAMALKESRRLSDDGP
jgi:hypothetical protein